MGDQIEHNIMGGARGTHGELERCIRGFVRETSGTEGHCPRRKWEANIKTYCIVHLVQDWDKRRPLVSTVIQLMVL